MGVWLCLWLGRAFLPPASRPRRRAPRPAPRSGETGPDGPDTHHDPRHGSRAAGHVTPRPPTRPTHATSHTHDTDTSAPPARRPVRSTPDPTRAQPAAHTRRQAREESAATETASIGEHIVSHPVAQHGRSRLFHLHAGPHPTPPSAVRAANKLAVACSPRRLPRSALSVRVRGARLPPIQAQAHRHPPP